MKAQEMLCSKFRKLCIRMCILGTLDEPVTRIVAPTKPSLKGVSHHRPLSGEEFGNLVFEIHL